MHKQQHFDIITYDMFHCKVVNQSTALLLGSSCRLALLAALLLPLFPVFAPHRSFGVGWGRPREGPQGRLTGPASHRMAELSARSERASKQSAALPSRLRILMIMMTIAMIIVTTMISITQLIRMIAIPLMIVSMMIMISHVFAEAWPRSLGAARRAPGT